MKQENELLLRSFDAPLNKEERRSLEEALAQSEALRREKTEVDNLRTQIANFNPDFSSGFTERIMQRIANETGFAFQTVFRTIAFSGMAAIILVLLSVYYVDGSLNLNSLLGINGYAPDLGLLSFF